MAVCCHSFQEESKSIYLEYILQLTLLHSKHSTCQKGVELSMTCIVNKYDPQ